MKLRSEFEAVRSALQNRSQIHL